MIRPIDRDAFSLVRSILEHRYASVRAERITSIRERSTALERTSKGYTLLQERFTNLKRHWIAWSYPSTSGRSSVDECTPVPPADAEYVPAGKNMIEANAKGGVQSITNEAMKLWESFLSTLKASKINDVNPNVIGSSYFLGDFRPTLRADSYLCRKRLSVFVRLGNGEAVDMETRSLPHIENGFDSINNSTKRKQPKNKPKNSYLRQSERCWRSLLLSNDEFHESEWEEVVNKFTKPSRTKKNLNIVQQRSEIR